MMSAKALHFQNTVPLAWYSACMNVVAKKTKSEFSVGGDDTVVPASNVHTMAPDDASSE